MSSAFPLTIEARNAETAGLLAGLSLSVYSGTVGAFSAACTRFASSGVSFPIAVAMRVAPAASLRSDTGRASMARMISLTVAVPACWFWKSVKRRSRRIEFVRLNPIGAARASTFCLKTFGGGSGAQ